MRSNICFAKKISNFDAAILPREWNLLVTNSTMKGNLKFSAAYGEETKQVEISNVCGNGGSYHLYIDNYFAGSFTQRNEGWELLFNKGVPSKKSKLEPLQSADICILEEIFIQNFIT